MTLKDLKNLGIFKLMPNGFNIYDFKTEEDITDKYDELLDKNVKIIGSDPYGEIEVPAIFVEV